MNMERHKKPTRKDEESSTVKNQKSVFESVFDESYIPFEKLFDESYLGEHASRHAHKDEPCAQTEVEDD
jgi:hypothetical protein